MNNDDKMNGTLPKTPASTPAPVFASANLRPPPSFNFSNLAQWKHWLVQFEDYLYALGLYAADEVRVCTLLYTMSLQAREILSSLQVSEADMADY